MLHILESVEPLHCHLQHVKLAAMTPRCTSVTRRGHPHSTHQPPVQMRVAGIPDHASCHTTRYKPTREAAAAADIPGQPLLPRTQQLRKPAVVRVVASVHEYCSAGERGDANERRGGGGGGEQNGKTVV